MSIDEIGGQGPGVGDGLGGWGAPPGPPGLYSPGGEVPPTPSPALFPRAPIPGPPTVLPGPPPNVDGMLLPATPAPAAPPVSPNAPLLPAEGMPPS